MFSSRAQRILALYDAMLAVYGDPKLAACAAAVALNVLESDAAAARPTVRSDRREPRL